MRELMMAEWIEECEKRERTAHNVVKAMGKSEHLKCSCIGFAANTFAFDEREFESLKYRLQNQGEVYEFRAFMRYETEEVLVQYPDDEEVEEWSGQVEKHIIETFRLATIKELREKVGMTQKAFGDYLHVPKRSVQNWENGVTSCPDYVLIFISEKIYNDFFKKDYE